MPALAQFLPAPPDTSADTSAVDTVTISDVLRADSTLYRLTQPGSFGNLVDALRSTLLDPAIWIGLLGVLLQIFLILLLAFVAIRLVDRFTGRWRDRVQDLPAIHPRRQRAFTISNLVSSTARYVVWPLALIMLLSEIGVEVGALLATAGVAGLAIGFGAQTLVRDVISGIFLLFDDTIHVGDLVRVGSEAGAVEEIGVRMIKVRKFDGELLMVPSGELRIFGNKSITFIRVVVDVPLSYEQDIETVLPVIKRVADEWAEQRREILLEPEPLVLAIMAFDASSVNARVAIKVIPGEQFQAERDLRLMLKREFDALGIEIPFNRQTVYLRREASLPPQKITDPKQPPSPELPPDATD